MSIEVNTEMLSSLSLVAGRHLSAAVFQAERRACPERSRRDLARIAATLLRLTGERLDNAPVAAATDHYSSAP
jgi:hypothetical protein